MLLSDHLNPISSVVGCEHDVLLGHFDVVVFVCFGYYIGIYYFNIDRGGKNSIVFH